MSPASAQRSDRPPSGHASVAGGGRIALFLPSLAGGGAERITLTLADGFYARGYAVDLVLAKEVGELLNQVPFGVRVVALGASRPLTAVPTLARYLAKERPIALLSKITNANVASLLAKQFANSPTRCVVCEESTFSIDLASSSITNRILLPRIVRHYYPQAHAVVAVSQGVANDLACAVRLPRKDIQIIYNPIISEDLREAKQQLAKYRCGLNDARPLIVGMGRLTRQKDFGTLIRAFALVRGQLPSRLIILGEGEERNALKILSSNLGVAEDVEMPGFVSNPYAFLSRAALFVLSSRWEGFGNVLAEALAIGVPVISTDCPNGPSEILNAGAYGQLVPVEDSDTMATAMLAALKGDFIAANADEWIKQFDANANIDRYLELLVGDAGERVQKG